MISVRIMAKGFVQFTDIAVEILQKNPDMFLSLLWSFFNSLFKLYHVRSPDNLRGYHAFEVCKSDMFIFLTK